MKIKTVEVAKDLRMNLGNYESAMFRAGFTATVEGGDDPEEVAQMLSGMCDEQLARDVAKFESDHDES